MTGRTSIGEVVCCDGDVVQIEANASVADAARTMRDRKTGCLVVAGTNGGIGGIITERDVSRKTVAEAKDPESTLVSEVMTRNIMACTPRTSVAKAQEVMAAHHVRHIPIVEDGQLVGMISSTDILSHRIEAAEAMLRQQSAVLRDLEDRHPGISSLQKDASGRILI